MKVAIPDPRSMGLTLQEELRQHICSQDPCSKFQRNLGFLGPDLWIESTQKMIQLLWLSSNSKCQRVIMFLGFLGVFSHLRVNIVWCGQDWTRILFCFFEFFLTAMNEDIAVPKKTALYKYRIDLDLASMLWARQHCFGLDAVWYVHCRLDSSPQYNKDYFMTECDIFRPDATWIRTWEDIGTKGVLVTRLLVGQNLGARASSVIIKTQKLLHQLSLDPGLLLKGWMFYAWNRDDA